MSEQLAKICVAGVFCAGGRSICVPINREIRGGAAVPAQEDEHQARIMAEAANLMR